MFWILIKDRIRFIKVQILIWLICLCSPSGHLSNYQNCICKIVKILYLKMIDSINCTWLWVITKSPHRILNYSAKIFKLLIKNPIWIVWNREGIPMAMESPKHKPKTLLKNLQLPFKSRKKKTTSRIWLNMTPLNFRKIKATIFHPSIVRAILIQVTVK